MASGRWNAALCALALACGTLGGCATSHGAASSGVRAGASQDGNARKESDAKALPAGLDPAGDLDPFPSTYRPLSALVTAIVGARVLTATGLEIDGGTVVFANGKIVAVGKDAAVPAGAQVIDGRGKWVTPGVVDAHSHLGVYPSPAVPARSDGNELTDPNTAGDG